MDVNNNIIRTIFSVLNPGFFGNAANVGRRRSVFINGESADVPEDIVKCSGLVAALPAVCNGYTPKVIFSVDDTVMHCRSLF